jgi:glycosyltransferase involved in cell wall biosynthesis
MQARSVVIALPVLLVGGTEIQTLNLVNVLVRAGYDVTVCCYYEYDQSVVDRFENVGAKVLLMKYERSKGLWHLAKGLIKVFKTGKPDIVHVQYVAPGFVPVVAARLAGIRTIFATVHQPGRTYGWKAKLLLLTAAKLCTAFFCVSKSTEESWFGDSRLFDPGHSDKKRRHFTIYNAVNVERIGRIVRSVDREELKKNLGINGKKVVGVVGRLRWEKGQEIIVDALHQVVKAIPSAVLVVVGDGPDKKKLRKRAEDLKLENHVKWLGQKSPEEVYKLYSIMDVVAVPSRFEGFGLTAAEAMAAGVPVVATRADGLSEVVEDGLSGYLVALGDSYGVAQAVTDLLSSHEKARDMGREGYKRVCEQFSFEKFSNSVRAVYRENIELTPFIREI